MFVAAMVLETRSICVSCSFDGVSRSRRFFGGYCANMMLVVRQVDFPVATRKGKDFVAALLLFFFQIVL